LTVLVSSRGRLHTVDGSFAAACSFGGSFSWVFSCNISSTTWSVFLSGDDSRDDDDELDMDEARLREPTDATFAVVLMLVSSSEIL